MGRTSGISAGTFDVYYTSPLGKKLRSKVQVEKYCEEKGLEIDLGDIKFSHKATDKEKSSLFLKAGNDLAAGIYADSKDNEKAGRGRSSRIAKLMEKQQTQRKILEAERLKKMSEEKRLKELRKKDREERRASRTEKKHHKEKKRRKR